MSVLIPTLLTVFTLLVFALPLALPAFRSKSSLLNIAASFAVTLALLSIVATIAGNAGWGIRRPIQITILISVGLCLLLLAQQRFRPQGQLTMARVGPKVFATVAIVGTAIWMVLPAYIALAQIGSTLGLVTPGNLDIANYDQFAMNMDQSGYTNSRHIAGTDIGTIAKTASGVSPSALLVSMSAVTGLQIWQVTLAAMSVAVVFLTLSLGAFTAVVWPGRPGVAVLAGIIGTVIPLSSYVITNYFIGGILGVACVTLSLAAVTSLATRQENQRACVIALCAGCTAGLYSYSVLMIPAILALGVWAVVARAVWRSPTLPKWHQVNYLIGAPLGSGLLLAIPVAPTIVAVLRLQAASDNANGWPLPVLNPWDLLLRWPATGTGASVNVVASWLVVGLVVATGLTLAWRKGHQSSVKLAGLFVFGIAVVCIAAAGVYGPEQYRTWKLQSYFAPIAVALICPAFAVITIKAREVGIWALGALAVVAGLSPLTTWSPVTADLVTGPAAEQLAVSPRLESLESVNVRMKSYFQNMALAAMLPSDVVVVSGPSYWNEQADLTTCTLVTTSEATSLPPESVEVLNAKFALIAYPAPCRVKAS